MKVSQRSCSLAITSLGYKMVTNIYMSLMDVRVIMDLLAFVYCFSKTNLDF